MLLMLAGCANSEPLAEESTGESYLQERLARLHPSLGPHQIAVLCRRDDDRRLACGSSVTGSTGGDALRQRWAVDLDRSGRVTAARAVSSPHPSKAQEPTPVAPAAREAGRATARRRPTPRGRARRRMEIVWFRITPRRRAIVCVDTGHGRRLFGATRMAVVSLKRARLHSRLRRRSAVITVRGRPSARRGRLSTVDIRPGRLRPLRPRDRRC